MAVGERTSLNQPSKLLGHGLTRRGRNALGEARYGPFRAGDVRHSKPDIGKVRRLLGYAPTHDIAARIEEALPWYLAQAAGNRD